MVHLFTQKNVVVVISLYHVPVTQVYVKIAVDYRTENVHDLTRPLSLAILCILIFQLLDVCMVCLIMQ